MRQPRAVLLQGLRTEIRIAQAKLGDGGGPADLPARVAASLRIAYAVGFLKGVALVDPAVAETLQPELTALETASESLSRSPRSEAAEDVPPGSNRPASTLGRSLPRQLFVASDDIARITARRRFEAD